MPVNWHQRYLQQSRWTKPLRDFLLRDITIQPTSSVLEVGCGTGAICTDLLSAHSCSLHGLDINFNSLEFAIRNNSLINYSSGDAFSLPYCDDVFDLVYCHYFLLWISKPDLSLKEIFRVLKPNGIFLVFAEPDYAARIDAPVAFEELGKMQNDSLIKQCADISIGRKIPALLSSAGFSRIDFGASGFQTNVGELPDWWQSEWEVIFDDLSEILDQALLLKYQELDRSSWKDGSRVLWIPTFYAKAIKLH